MEKVKKDWILKPFETKKINELKSELKISHLICKLLVQRGIYGYDEAKDFFRPKLEQLHDPFLMKGMKKACKRISTAIDNNESILIYGDYDVDGTTAVSLMYSFLKPLNKNIEYYIPDRYKEGYGVSEKAIEYASEKKVRVIISLDCGITNLKEVELAQKNNIDFIICDHHLPEKHLPKAFSILNPKQKDCKYPFKELSGCGVGFKLIQGISINRNLSKEIAFEKLDLVAISIACDMVTVSGENRILAHFGLRLLNKNTRAGIKLILNSYLVYGAASQSIYDLRFSDLAFKIGPKINAAGRMGDAKDAVRLLLSDKNKTAIEFYAILKEKNEARKQKQNSVIEIALDYINKSPELLNKNSMVLYDDSWHKGVVGIAASKLIEHFFKPTIIFAGNDNIITGSARSIPGINIHKAINDCSKWLVRFGGHKMAAGLSLKKSDLMHFTNDFEKAINKQMHLQDIKPELHIDTELAFDEISPSLINIIKQMEPFGPGNTEPLFISKGLFDTGLSKIVKKEHLKLNIKQKGANKLMNGIAFNQAKAYDKITKNNNFALCYTLYENTWQNKKNIELMVKDFSFNNENTRQ